MTSKAWCRPRVLILGLSIPNITSVIKGKRSVSAKLSRLQHQRTQPECMLVSSWRRSAFGPGDTLPQLRRRQWGRLWKRAMREGSERCPCKELRNWRTRLAVIKGRRSSVPTGDKLEIPAQVCEHHCPPGSGRAGLMKLARIPPDLPASHRSSNPT